jgi:hypothetical protein
MNGIYNHILYVTPTNVLIKSIESAQIPQFNVKFSNESSNVSCKLMIEDKYISCFLLICNEWYVMMRLFGKTLNTGYFARTEGNKVFYKIKNISVDFDLSNPESGTGLIIVPNDSYTEVNNSVILSTTSSKQIKLNENCYTNINKQNSPKVFNVLQRFRQEKLFANYEKKEVAKDVAGDVFSGVFNFFSQN